MADNNAKLIVTLDLLTKYDTKIKKYVDDADAGVKSALEAFIGTIPAEATEKDVITYLTNYINAEVTAREGAIEAIENTIGTVAEGKTVVEMIADAKTAATYDDTAVKADIKANADAIEVLNGTSAVDGSVAKAIDSAFNDFATKMSDDGAVNTFKELVDYAATHNSEYSTLAGEVQANTTAIGTLNGSGAGSVAKAVSDAIGELGALAEKDTIADADVAADAAIAQSKIAGLATSLAGKVDVVEGKGLSANDFTNAYKAQLDGLTAALAAKQDVIPEETYEAFGAAAEVDEKVGEIPTSSEATTVVGYVDEQIAAVQDNLVYASEDDINNLFK